MRVRLIALLVAVAVDAHTSHVVVANADGNRVSILDARTGVVLRTVLVGKNPFAVAVDARTRRAFVLNDLDNSVSILDTRTGAVLRTVPVGHAPFAAAVDAPTGRAFVVNSHDNSVSVLRGNGDGSFGPPIRVKLSYPDGYTGSYVTVGDFNGDGITDLAMSLNQTTEDIGKIAMYQGSGDGGFQPAQFFSLDTGVAN